MTEKKNFRNPCLDALKGICCLAVVFMHCRFPGKVGSMISYVLRFPVPVFFMISGYYGFAKDKKKLFRSALSILRIWVLCEAVYFALNCLIHLIQGGTISSFLVESFGGINVLKTIVFDPIFCGPAWYLVASFWTYIIVVGLKQVAGESWHKWLFILVPVLLIIALFGRYYIRFRGIDPEKYIYQFRSALLFGIPFYGIGAYIYYYTKEKKHEIHVKAISALFIAGCVLFILEYVIDPVIHDFQISTIFIAIALFLFAQKYITIPRYLYPLAFLGSIFSMWIYVSHVAFRTMVDTVADYVSIAENAVFLWLRPLVILGLCILFSFLMTIHRQKQLSIIM